MSYTGKMSLSQRAFKAVERSLKKLLGAMGLGNSRVIRVMARLRGRLKKKINTTVLEAVDIYVAEHCNLGCYSCNHFSHLAEPEFADLETTDRDLKRLAELSGGNIPAIMLVGGEPLLNPNLHEFMRVARENFPNSLIQIVTNGVLLLAQKDIFWESAKKYNIVMTPTKYPGIAWEKIEQRAARFGYRYDYFDLTGDSEKVSRKFCLDLSGSQDMKKSFNRCPMAACTVALHNGRLATCCFVFTMRHFNKFFGKQVPVTDDDSIDIYQARSMKEILKFLFKPIPLCRYCKSMGNQIVGEWRTSEKKIEEYT